MRGYWGRGGVGGSEELLFDGVGFFYFGIMKMFWKWIVEMIIQHC